MYLFFAFLVPIVVSLILIPILIRYAGVLHMLDEPGDRKVHVVAIPRCGGIGLFIGAISAILIFVPFEREVLSLIIGSIVIVFFGFLDDRFELSYKWKFLGQIIAVLAVIIGGVYISFLPFNGLEPGALYFTLPLTVFFVVGVTNAVNLSDGLDGLAAGIMLMTFATIAFLAVDASGAAIAMVSLAVAGGIVGFLWFNTHPAVVFMGDTGSQFIGFMAVFLSVYLTQGVNQMLNPALPLLLLGLPILDTLSVMVRRIRAGRSPFSADKTHIHHRFIEIGFSHAEAVASIYLLQSLFLASAIAFRYASDFLVIGAYLIISASILLFFYWSKETQWQLHSTDIDNERRGSSLFRNEKLFQFCRHYINYALALFLLVQIYFLLEQILSQSFDTYLSMLCAVLVFSLLSKPVQDIWVRFSIYLAAIFASVMTQRFPHLDVLTHWAVDVYLIILMIVISLAIRITRKSKFRVTTQDLLVVLFVIATVLFIDFELIEYITLRLFCLVYALEYLINRDFYKFRLSRYLAAVSGLVMVVIILPSFQFI